MMSTGCLARKGLYLFFAAVLFHSSNLYSAQISNVQFYLNGGDAFDGTNFFIHEQAGSSSEVSGIMEASGEADYYYEIRGGKIDIDSSPLLEDQTADYGYPVAVLLSGSSVTMEGSIWRNVPGQTPYQVFPNGTLISATIQNDFYINRDEYSTDTIYAGLDLGINGGELFDGSTTGIKLIDNHLVSYISLYFCTSERTGGNIVNFSPGNGYISYLSSSTIQMYAAPEPCTMILLSLGLAALRIKK